jgi:hypothetical protein
MPAKEHPRWRAVVVTLLFCAAVLPAALMLQTVLTHWTPLPYWDEWTTPGNQLRSLARGTLTFSELFSQHNESRKFFPRLFYLVLAKWHGWDVRDGMIATYVSVCVIVLLLGRLLRVTPGYSAIAALVTCTVMTFLCFAPVQYNNFLWGLQFEPFFPCLALLAAGNINLSKCSFRLKATLNAVLAFLATYTFANGMVLWVLAFPLPASSEPIPRSRRNLWQAIFSLCAVVSLGAYFSGYRHPLDTPPLALSLSSFGDLQHYLILWVGGYFRSRYLDPFVAGFFVLTTLALTLAAALILMLRSRQWRWFYPWLLLALYAGASGMVTAVGRIGFGLGQALDARYAVFSLSAYLAISGGLFAIYCHTRRCAMDPAHRATFAVAVSLFVLAVPAWSETFLEGREHLVQKLQLNRRLLCALEWIDPIPDNPDLALITPNVDLLKTNARALASAGLLRLPFVDGVLAESVRRTPHAANFKHGTIDAATTDKDGNLVISGWAWLPEKDRQPDCIVIGWENLDGNFQLLGITKAGMEREDVAKFFGNPKMVHAGFWARLRPKIRLPQGGHAGAWAVDSKSKRAWPLATFR